MKLTSHKEGVSMKRVWLCVALISVSLSPLYAQDVDRASRANKAPAKSSNVPTATPVVVPDSTDQGVRDVSASARAVIPIWTQLRFSTLVLLPEGEEIIDVVCGDSVFWIIQTTSNMANIKPAKAGAKTNLNLVTATGTVYSFILQERDTKPDLRVYVTTEQAPSTLKRKFVAVDQLEAVKAELVAAREQAEAERTRAAQAVSSAKREVPATMRFTYVDDREGKPIPNKKPFNVQSIWHDGEFTYIRSGAKELPSLYEMKDGQPSVLNFQVHDGTYVVPKVLDHAYLAIGTARLAFRSTEN
jgi:type IV secretory pathway VirB9-like protein